MIPNLAIKTRLAGASSNFVIKASLESTSRQLGISWMTTPASNATPYLRNKMRDGYQSLIARTPEQFGLRAFNVVLQIAIGYARPAHTIMRYSRETYFDILHAILGASLISFVYTMPMLGGVTCSSSPHDLL